MGRDLTARAAAMKPYNQIPSRLWVMFAANDVSTDIIYCLLHLASRVRFLALTMYLCRCLVSSAA